MNKLRIKRYAKEHGHTIIGKLQRAKTGRINGKRPPAWFYDDAGAAYFPRKARMGGVVIVPNFCEVTD